MSRPESPRPSLGAFWHDLPHEGKLLLSVVVFEFVGTGLVLPFWIVYLHEVRGFSLSTSGLLLGLQPLMGLGIAVPGGALIDRIGARVVLASAIVSVMAGEVVVAFASTTPLAALGLALSGMAFGVSFPAAQTLVATIVPTAIRQRYFGLNFTLLNLGIGLGGLLGGALVDVDRLWTFQLIYLVDAATFVPSLFLLLVPLRHVSGRAEHDPESDAARPSYREVLRLPAMPTLILVTFVGSFVAYAQLNSGMPAFARVVADVSTQGLGIAFACNTLVIVLLQLFVLQRIEGHRRTRVMVVMSTVWALSWLLLGASGLVPGTFGATLLVAACASVFALGETFLQPTLPAITNDLATDRLRGRTNALASLAFQLPMVVAPPVAGWLIGHDLQLVYIAGLVVGCAAVALLAVGRLEPQLSDVANGTSPAATNLSPSVHTPGETTPARPTPFSSADQTP
ncbi:MAG: MFS transporter [Nocardioidaceae bacterium]